ncbi:MAG TPA: VWA domain-containing protein [Rhabdochlamydiaceae bacterium]|nr:VWA domain-containing protein [Rhabdochlamydiaceae bacterium]
MRQVSFGTAFALQTILSLAGTFAASRFSLISYSSAPVQAAAFVATSLLQTVLQKNYRLNKGYYFASFVGMTGMGFLLNTSWKVNLLMSTLFVTLQSIFSHFQKPNNKVPPQTGKPLTKKQPESATEPLTCQLTSTTDLSTDCKNHYILLELSANDQKDKDLLTPAPAEFIFCIDISASMSGPRITKVKNVLNSLLTKMKEEVTIHQDSPLYISLVTFDNKAKTIQKRIQVTQANIAKLQSVVNRINTFGGGTSIMAALEETTRVLENLSVLNAIATLFVTPLAQSQAQGVDTCARSLIFLTDGEDRFMNETRVRELQQKWVEKSVNLFAIGISKGHTVETMKMIICDQAKQLLPNASYQWIPDDEDEESTEGTTLEKACSAIFSQTLNQNIQSISVRQTSHPILQLLNSNQNKDGASTLGSLSKGQKIQKIFYCDSSEFTKFSLEISVQTQQGNRTFQSTIDLSDTYSAQIHLIGIKQRIVEMNTKLSKIKDKPQKTDLAKPVLQEAEALSSNDSDLKNLIEDLKKTIAGTDNNDQDTGVRHQRIQRGRFDQ